MTRGPAASILLGLVLALLLGGGPGGLLAGCRVAPIREEPGPPIRHEFYDPHGRPLAYGGGVCPFLKTHSHSYPPVPREAFLDCEEGARETRPLYAFFDEHAREDQTCFRSGWHLHVEPPVGVGPDAPAESGPRGARVRWDEERAAYMAGPRGEHACEQGPCVNRSGARDCDPAEDGDGSEDAYDDDSSSGA